MPSVLLHRVELADPPAANVAVRLHRVELDGSAPPSARLHRVEFEGTVAVEIAAEGTRVVEPGDVITLTPRLQPGVVPTSYSFTQTAGPVLELTGTGGSRSFVAPSDATGTSVSVRVTATLDGVTSNPVTFIFSVLPEIEWRATSTGWKPLRVQML